MTVLILVIVCLISIWFLLFSREDPKDQGRVRVRDIVSWWSLLIGSLILVNNIPKTLDTLWLGGLTLLIIVATIPSTNGMKRDFH